MWDKMTREERIKAVQAGVDQKMSSTQIAAAIGGGCTRNSVIGLAHRCKIGLVATAASVARMKADSGFKRRDRDAKQLGPVKPEPAKRDHLKISIAPARKKVVEQPPVLEFPDDHYRTHIEDIRSGQCRWPQWGNEPYPKSESLFFCGKPVRSASLYCHRCHKRAFLGIPTVRKKDPLDRQRRGQLA